MPNLDRMGRDKLLAFWSEHSRPKRKGARELTGGGEGHLRAAWDLANYASNRAAQLYCRSHGDKVGEQIYKKICDDILIRIPPRFTWLW